MGFKEKLKYIATGKTEEERKAEADIMSSIRKKANEARFKERELQEIEFAKKSEQIKYNRKLKELQRPKSNFSFTTPLAPEYRNYGSVYGSPRIVNTKKVKTKVGKGKKRRTVIKTVRTSPSYQFQGVANRGRYNILGW
ncbi:MAG: hypothetical protein WC758_08230 [Candidatus Woesearchaeota archaeon]|jgi:hypothetical protein